MRDTLDASAEKTTWFLGAGASAALTKRPVLTTNLLRIALTDAAVLQAVGDEDRKAAIEFVRFLAPENEWPAVDDVLGVIEVALADSLPLSTYWSLDRLHSVRRSLHTLVYECIEETLTPTRAGRLDEAAPLVENLLDAARRTLPVIVTLNWDCLIERIFSRVHDHRRYVIDYVVSSVTPEGKPRPRCASALRVLKPHGSLSWGYCALCNLLVTDSIGPYRFSTGRPCPKCSEPVEAVLVPPVSAQRAWPTFLPALWQTVEDELQESNRIVFVGYSLPPQDLHVRVHVIRALARRAKRNAESPLHVEVVLKRSASHPDLVELEENRYRTVLGGLVAPERLRFFKEGFLDWLVQQP